MKLLSLALIGFCIVSGCGGEDSPEERAKALYGTYRSTEDERDDAEQRLRDAFSDIARAAEQQDADGVRAAAERGQSAASDIETFLAREVDAAEELEEISGFEADASRLKRGLETTGEGLALFAEQLEVALDDPFLGEAANRSRISSLARRATELSTEGELLVRRADRALALALGIEPRVDAVLDAPTTTS